MANQKVIGVMQMTPAGVRDGFHLAIGGNGLSHVRDGHPGNFWNEHFPALHLFNATDLYADSLVESVQKRFTVKDVKGDSRDYYIPRDEACNLILVVAVKGGSSLR